MISVRPQGKPLNITVIQAYAPTSNAQKAEFEWFIDFPGGSNGKVSAYNVGNLVQSLGREDLLEKEMASHSSVLAWKIPWMEEPGRLQFMG